MRAWLTPKNFNDVPELNVEAVESGGLGLDVNEILGSQVDRSPRRTLKVSPSGRSGRTNLKP